VQITAKLSSLKEKVHIVRLCVYYCTCCKQCLEFACAILRYFLICSVTIFQYRMLSVWNVHYFQCILKPLWNMDMLQLMHYLVLLHFQLWNTVIYSLNKIDIFTPCYFHSENNKSVIFTVKITKLIVTSCFLLWRYAARKCSKTFQIWSKHVSKAKKM
jgi:hypothetical protein